MTTMTTGALITASTIRALTPELLAFAVRAVRQREDAEDLVQETWICALRAAMSFEGRSTLRSWLVTILRRRIADYYRRRRRWELLDEERIADAGETATECLEVRWAARIAREALLDLPEIERNAVTLCDLHDCDRNEVSQRIKVTRGHLRVLLHRARHKLETSLRASGVER